MIEAIKICEERTGNKMKPTYVENDRIGDHIWWISDVSKFKSHFPNWNHKRNVGDILIEIFELNIKKWISE